MGILETLTLALGASWASGLNLYAAVALLGFLDLFGIISLPENLQVLSNPWVLGAAVFMYAVEFFADKIPGVDSIWDVIQTFIRVPAGALLSAGAVGGLDIGISSEIQTVLALLVGGTIAAGSHLLKAGSRAIINTSPEPASNWAASIFEDVLVFVGLSIAVFKPIIFITFFGIFVIFAVWLLPKIWRGICRVFSRAQHPVETMRGGREQAFVLTLGGTPSDSS
jgi:hypothetical protein